MNRGALGLGVYYAAVFLGTGAAGPYMPLWFAAKGLSGAEIGLLLSAPMLARAVTAPALALWADGFTLRRTPLILMGAAAAAGYLALAAPLGFWGWFVAWFLAASVFSSLSPLADVIALARARADGFNFGWPRGIGSAAYIVANVVAGALVARWSPSAALVWIIAAAAVAAAAARWALPADPVRGGGRASVAGLGQLLRDRAFVVAVVSAGLIQSSHAFYYSFSALAWRRQGIGEAATGVLWGVGVAVEVAFMWFLEPWRRRLGARWLLVLAGVAGALRWTVLGFAPPLWALPPLQALHALTFAATFLAALQLAEEFSTPANATAAQAINSALSGGVLAGAATIVSGWLFDKTGTGGYFAMTAMTLAGLAGAVTLARSGRR